MNKQKTKRILLIGAKGMLGRDLLKILRSSNGTDSLENFEVIEWDVDEIDIRQEVSTLSKIESLRPDIVIHLAAYTDVDGCEINPEEAFRVNAEGMKHVAMGAQACGARVVYLSTDYVFDGEKKEAYVESDPPHPLNVYGQTKLKGERYLQERVEDHLIIRTQWLYGKYGKNFVSSILRQAREKQTLTIVNDQTGSPTYTVDLSKAIRTLIQHNSRGIFHVANQEVCTWYTFGQAILKFSRIEGVSLIPISSKELSRRAVRPSYSVLNTQKMRRETGMSLRSWSEALKEYLSTSPYGGRGISVSR
jgi:dTDP-4-dehydrorhamnose reductase